MGRDYEMTWNRFTGTIKGDGVVAEVEMRPNNEGWECRIKRDRMDDGGTVKEFGPGKLGDAHDWCMEQISDYEESTKH